MSYEYYNDAYKGLFTFGDTEDEVRDRAMKIYFKNNMDFIRVKYKKYSRRYKTKRKEQ